MRLAYLKATDGLQAFEIYRDAKRVDVILMDLHMPVMNGLEANRAIRKLEQEEGRERVTIFVLTAAALQHAKQEAMDSGADRCFGKPMSMQGLAEAIRKICGGEGFGSVTK